MLYVYDVSVMCWTLANGELQVEKRVRKLRVVKTGTEYFTCSLWPKDHFMAGSNPLRVRKSSCFTDLEDAYAEANERANEWIAELMRCVATLKADAEIFDKTRIAEGESID